MYRIGAVPEGLQRVKEFLCLKHLKQGQTISFVLLLGGFIALPCLPVDRACLRPFEGCSGLSYDVLVVHLEHGGVLFCGLHSKPLNLNLFSLKGTDFIVLSESKAASRDVVASQDGQFILIQQAQDGAVKSAA